MAMISSSLLHFIRLLTVVGPVVGACSFERAHLPRVWRIDTVPESVSIESAWVPPPKWANVALKEKQHLYGAYGKTLGLFVVLRTTGDFSMDWPLLCPHVRRNASSWSPLLCTSLPPALNFVGFAAASRVVNHWECEDAGSRRCNDACGVVAMAAGGQCAEVMTMHDAAEIVLDVVEGTTGRTVLRTAPMNVSWSDVLVAPPLRRLDLTQAQRREAVASAVASLPVSSAIAPLWRSHAMAMTESPLLAPEAVAEQADSFWTVAQPEWVLGRQAVRRWSRFLRSLERGIGLRASGRWSDHVTRLRTSLLPDQPWSPVALAALAAQRNGQYQHGDDAVLFAVAQLKLPRLLVEVGSGFSTRAAMAGLLAGLLGRAGSQGPVPTARHVAIEPFLAHRMPPPTIYDDACANGTLCRVQFELLQVRAETLPQRWWRKLLLQQQPRAMENTQRPPVLLVIDGSHVAAPFGDVDSLLHNVLPLLPSGSLVHVHDITLPLGFEAAAVAATYSENRILASLLSGQGRYRVVAPLFIAAAMDAEAALYAGNQTPTSAEDVEAGRWWHPRQGSPLAGTGLGGCGPLGSSLYLEVV